MINRASFTVAITGASAPVLGLRLAEILLASFDVHLIITQSALKIIGHEMTEGTSGKDSEKDSLKSAKSAQNPPKIIKDPLNFALSRLPKKGLHVYRDDRLDAPIASGTFRTGGMFIVPCSMKTLSGVANGYSENLVQRAADVTIKEGRRLVIAPREMPFSAIHLENMLKLARLGVTVAPPVAAFYTLPRSIDDMVDFFVGKLLDAMNIPHELFKRWGTDCGT
jgi:4-hydroxy-3-polyprenylbenzoate decarboxylase